MQYFYLYNTLFYVSIYFLVVDNLIQYYFYKQTLKSCTYKIDKSFF